MNYKPDESTLIAYLYGELNEKDNALIEKYFQHHPEELSRLEGLGDVRELMGHVQDKEVIAPPVFVDHTGEKPIWHSAYIRVGLGIAASVLFLLGVGKILGPEINYAKGELSIRFGKKVETVAPVNNLTEEKVNEMIVASLEKNNESLTDAWTEDQRKLMRSLVDFNSKKIEAMTKQASLASQEQVRSFVSNLQDQNLKLMKDYFQLSTADQKKYMEGLLVDFSSYLQEQRKQDLQFVQTKMNYLEKNNNQLKQETEQILTSLIGKSGKKKNSY